MRILTFILTAVFISASSFYAQLELSISTDKTVYEYGETIEIICSIVNNTDMPVSFLAGCSSSKQAEFLFNDFDSQNWDVCFTYPELLNFPPGGSRTYTWLIDPQKFGFPNLDGVQTIIGYFLGNEEYFTKGIDTTTIQAPLYLGGELNVGYLISNDSLVADLKDSLGISVISGISLNESRSQTWRFTGIQIDSLFKALEDDYRILYVEFNRLWSYETITSINDSPEIPESFIVSSAYPNPFNPTTKFYVELPETEKVEIDLYNAIGEKVMNIYSGEIRGREKYYFEIDGDNLSSGIYYYFVRSNKFFEAKKIVLMK